MNNTSVHSFDAKSGNTLGHSGRSASSDRRPFLLLCVLVFLVVLGLTALTPMVSDDYAYCFSFADWTRIRHVGQIIPSMAEHRNGTNGRVIVHGLVQLLLLLPRPVYCVLNALNAVLLCVLIRRMIALPSRKQEMVILLFGICWFCCFLPAFGENVLWLDGSLNYFWGLSCSLLFLYPYLNDYLRLSDCPFMAEHAGTSREEHAGRNRAERMSNNHAELPHSHQGNSDAHGFSLSDVIRIFLAFIFGTWSENASLVFLFLAVCLLIFQWMKTRRFRLFPLFWIIAAVAGYVFLMTAPATSGRAGAPSISVIGYNFRLVFQAARDYLLWPLLIYAVLFALAVSYRVEKRVLIVSVFLFLGALSTHLSYTFAAYFVPRHLCATVFLLLLAAVLLLAGLCRVNRPVFSGVALACLSVLFLLQFPVGVLDVAISDHKQQLREQQIKTALAAGQRSVVLENYYPYTAYAVPFELNPVDPSVGPNINVADYYGLDEVLGEEPESEQ